MAALVSLRSRLEFNRLRQSGKRAKPSSWMIIYRQRNQIGRVRLGCTVPRYVGTAVVRNRLKRWSKEYFRQWAKNVETEKTLDISLIFLRKEAETYKDLKHEELDAVFDICFA